MNRFIEQVQEFHEVFGHPVGTKLKPFPLGRGIARLAYKQEELDELGVAIADGDIVETFDAIGDLVYFLMGDVVELGGQEIFEKIFTEIHRSNMSKACTTEGEALRTIDKYEKEGISCYYAKVGKHYVCYNRNNDKVLKSVNYSKPDLFAIVEFYKTK